MQLDLASFQQQLDKTIKACYLLASQEPFFLNQARQMIWDRAQKNGFTHRQIFTIKSQDEVEAIKNHPVFADLFDRPCIEVSVQQALDAATGKAMTHLIACLNSRAFKPLIIISLEQNTYKLQKTQWFQALEALLTFIVIPPLSKEKLPYQLKMALNQVGLRVTRKAMGLIIEAVQGNTAAAFQTVEKLSLLYSNTEKPLSAEQVSQVLTNTYASFELHEFTQAIISQDVTLCLKTLNYLEHRHTPSVLVLGYLSRLVRTVIAVKHAVAQKQSVRDVFQKYNVWKDQTQVTHLADRLTRQHVSQLVDWMYRTERSAKGVDNLSPWHYLRLMSLLLMGHLPPMASTRC